MKTYEADRARLDELAAEVEAATTVEQLQRIIAEIKKIEKRASKRIKLAYN